MNLKIFRIRLIRMIDENEQDYSGVEKHIKCEIDVEASSLFMAASIVESTMNKNKYRIDYDNSCMILNPIFINE